MRLASLSLHPHHMRLEGAWRGAGGMSIARWRLFPSSHSWHGAASVRGLSSGCINIGGPGDRSAGPLPSSSPSAPPPAAAVSSFLTAESYPRQWRMVLLRRALEQQGMVQQLEAASGNRNVGSGEETGVPAHLMSRSAFDEVCRLSHVTNPDAAIDALEQAGIIVALENRTLIHLRPAQYLAEQELVEFLMTPSAASPAKKPSIADTVLPSACVLEEEVLARIQRLASEERAMRSKLTGAMRRATQWGNHRFTLLSLFIASQIAVVARLTFFELDWDTMEPVTYCMTVFTSIVLYSFYLWYHREATCDEFHSTFIARRVRRWAPKDFDWKRYEEVCAQLEEEKRVLEQIREWTSSH